MHEVQWLHEAGSITVIAVRVAVVSLVAPM